MKRRVITNRPVRPKTRTLIQYERLIQNERRLRTRRTLALPGTPIWYPLGSFLLRANDTVSVQISRRSNSAGWVVADGIRLMKV